MKFDSPNNILKTLTLYLSLLFLTSCAQLFTIVPSGNINEDINFEFYKNDNNDEILELKVESVILERRVFNIWRQIWIIWEEGDSEPPSLINIKYKETPTGLAEIMKPKKIRMGSSHRISVSGTLLSGENVYGIEVFHLGEDGEVIIAKGGGGVIISERR